MNQVSTSIIETYDLHKVYGAGSAAVHALRGVDITVHRGEFLSIMGQSGSGKSTLLHILACLHRPSAGRYMLDDVIVDETLPDNMLSAIRNRKIGVVFQQYNLLATEDLLNNVALPLVYAGMGRSQRTKRARLLLETVGLGKRVHHRPSEVSGGEAQRAAIARALANNPAVVLADEPTGNLDSKSGLEIMSIFQALNKLGRTIVQVTHDAHKAAYSNRIVYLRDGKVEKEERIGTPQEAPPSNADFSFLAGEEAGRAGA